MAGRIPLISCWVHHQVLQAVLENVPLPMEATELQCQETTNRWFVGEPQISTLNCICTSCTNFAFVCGIVITEDLERKKCQPGNFHSIILTHLRCLAKHVLEFSPLDVFLF